jgi:hypothetical protein
MKHLAVTCFARLSITMTISILIAAACAVSARMVDAETSHHHHQQPSEEFLRYLQNDNNNNDDTDQSSSSSGHYTYLVDANGNSYDPYSVAWRYLGMYIDCDLEEIEDESDYAYKTDDVFRRRQMEIGQQEEVDLFEHLLFDDRRRRDLNSGDERDDENDCSRKLLWAAYYDPQYKEGDEISSYQFYDWRNDVWDTSTCSSESGRKNNCRKMDCHLPRSRWQLIGVFQETEGLYDFAEQLIKHEGYCVWNDNEKMWTSDKEDENEEEGSGDGGAGGRRDRDLASGDDDGDSDAFEYMYNRQDNWAQQCTKMYLSDSNGNTLYRHTKPMSGGNITDGLYYDDDCTQRARMTFPQYIVQFYINYYYDEETGRQVAQNYQEGVHQWNEQMKDFQICQPCRSYSKIPNFNNNDQNDNHRSLNDNNDGYDGSGYDEKSGYNCVDHEGYQNCDQCYKFESKTSLQLASVEDLQRASDQGTILAVKAYGKVYGQGGINWSDDNLDSKHYIWILVAMFVVGILVVLIRWYKWSNIKVGIIAIANRLRSRRFHQNLRKAFFDEDNDEDKLRKQLDRIMEEQNQEMESIQMELDQAHSIRYVEWEQSRQQRGALGEGDGDGVFVNGSDPITTKQTAKKSSKKSASDGDNSEGADTDSSTDTEEE